MSCFSVDWVYLMRTRRPESQVPFSPRCLSARPSCFLAADARFSWLRFCCSFRAPTTLRLFRFHRPIKRTTDMLGRSRARPTASKQLQKVAAAAAAATTAQMAFTSCRSAQCYHCTTCSKMQKVTQQLIFTCKTAFVCSACISMDPVPV